ncbi:cation-transporting P-type ATPase [Enterococcus bulliens]
MEQKAMGLTSEEVKKYQIEFGFNELAQQKKEPFHSKILHILMEPMFVLLMVAALIYFFFGRTTRWSNHARICYCDHYYRDLSGMENRSNTTCVKRLVCT